MKGYLSLIFAFCLIAGSANTIADEHSAPTQPDVALSAYFCTLNDGRSMQDLDKAVAAYRALSYANNWNTWALMLTPRFSLLNEPDFYWLNFGTFDYLAEVGQEYAEQGQAVQKAFDKVVTCKQALYGSRLKYPLQDESTLAANTLVQVEWCDRKDGVSMDNMLARHSANAEAAEKNGENGVWNIIWPIAGVGPLNVLGEKQRDFAHMLWLPDMAAYMNLVDREVNGGDGYGRRNYLESYAECDGRFVYDVTIQNQPNREWR